MSESETFTADLSARIVAVLEEGKAADIVSLETARQSGGLFDRMIVATANSPRHAAALTRRVARALKEIGAPRRVEETAEREWSLIDAGSAVVHVMQSEARARYNLEELWGFERPPESDPESVPESGTESGPDSDSVPESQTESGTDSNPVPESGMESGTESSPASDSSTGK